MRSVRNISLVCSHCEGEAGDVIIGGVLDKPANTMHEKLVRYMSEQDDLRRLLLHEPRGRPEMSVVLVLPPCNPVLLETGSIPMKEPVTEVKLDTAAGLITAKAECSKGRCKSVSFENVPAFVYGLDKTVNIPGVGTILVDIAYGGQGYVIAQAKDLDIEIHTSNRDRLVDVDLGNRLKTAVLAQDMPTHPENPAIRGINNVIISEPLVDQDGVKSVKHTVIVTPGRLDRSPCGTGSSSRLAVLYARGQIQIGEKVIFRSVIETEFIGTVRGTEKVGHTDAVLPNIQGRAWITGERKVLLDPDDPFQRGFLI
ncbi:proline racemase [Aspergillus avenaceus]|uniref:Proline racemase n=1 Tax=Aspergillus avenaceus TaxID=36643 RepID=A0A5N6U2Q9_ASPAV|nr:proline racemase [Aspergillus avenaceus]